MMLERIARLGRDVRFVERVQAAMLEQALAVLGEPTPADDDGVKEDVARKRWAGRALGYPVESSELMAHGVAADPSITETMAAGFADAITDAQIRDAVERLWNPYAGV